jgi:cellulose synthase/poly-beta-1,6-N-acetylglucosamine synthase-like glycosyltransferase
MYPNSPSSIFLLAFDALIVCYIATFFSVNLVLLWLAFGEIRKQLRVQSVRPAAATSQRPFLPHVTLLVPAYNEEVTIVASIRSLLKLDYPSYEIVICNDGSRDATVEVLCGAYPFVRADIESQNLLATEPVRATYECREGLPPNVRRLLLLDKANGGKADALNAAINVAQGEWVTSMDADSLLVPDALLRAINPLLTDPGRIVAIGGQVGLSNGSVVTDGEIRELRAPDRWIGRFQLVEYMRSFAQGRTALTAIDGLLVLSGVFAVMRRDLVVQIGGFLTKHMRSKIGREYCSEGSHTVCEDMEIVVRLRRYLLDKGIPGRVVCLPFPVAWTEAPEVYRDLGKQRSRWYRGLLEVLYYHRAILFRRRFGSVGLFAMPYQLLFEAFAPIVEMLGYILLVGSAISGALDPLALLAFTTLATAMNLSLSSLSVLLCIHSDRGSSERTERASLFSLRPRDVAVLLVAGFVSTFGYRQYLLGWQLKGLWDFLKGRKDWDKFARKGFAVRAT